MARPPNWVRAENAACGWLPSLRAYWREINREERHAEAQARAERKARDKKRRKCKCEAYKFPHPARWWAMSLSQSAGSAAGRTHRPRKSPRGLRSSSNNGENRQQSRCPT